MLLGYVLLEGVLKSRFERTFPAWFIGRWQQVGKTVPTRLVGHVFNVPKTLRNWGFPLFLWLGRLAQVPNHKASGS